MKKISIVLCITILMLTFSLVSFAEVREENGGFAPSLSVPAVYIVPAEKDTASCTASDYLFNFYNPTCAKVIQHRSFADYRYFPDIMEQIDIISVAPRE